MAEGAADDQPMDSLAGGPATAPGGRRGRPPRTRQLASDGPTVLVFFCAADSGRWCQQLTGGDRHFAHLLASLGQAAGAPALLSQEEGSPVQTGVGRVCGVGAICAFRLPTSQAYHEHTQAMMEAAARAHRGYVRPSFVEHPVWEAARLTEPLMVPVQAAASTGMMPGGTAARLASEARAQAVVTLSAHFPLGTRMLVTDLMQAWRETFRPQVAPYVWAAHPLLARALSAGRWRGEVTPLHRRGGPGFELPTDVMSRRMQRDVAAMGRGAPPAARP
jgi:hypothetical protein